ncbi:MAG: hypothetical protein WCT85_00315 [Parachlamydiales bacterium]|jgi:hypothetical protein
MQNQRTKLCPNCDGRVELDANICPFCGNSILERNDTKNQKAAADNKTSSYEDTLSSLYPPPYKPKSMEAVANFSEDQESSDEEETEKTANVKSALIPTILFWIGINILTFSLILLFFSHDGILQLEWNAKFWFFYAIMALPLLYFGFKGLKEVD